MLKPIRNLDPSNSSYKEIFTKNEIIKTVRVAAAIFLFCALSNGVVWYFFPYSSFSLSYLGTSLALGFSLVTSYGIKSYLGWKKNFSQLERPSIHTILGFKKFKKISNGSRQHSQPAESAHTMTALVPGDPRLILMLPKDLFNLICLSFSVRDLSRLAQCCVQLKAKLNDEDFWKAFFTKYFFSLGNEIQNYKKECRIRYSYQNKIVSKYCRAFPVGELRSFISFKDRLILFHKNSLENPNGVFWNADPLKLPGGYWSCATDSFLLVGRYAKVEVFDSSFERVFDLHFPGYKEGPHELMQRPADRNYVHEFSFVKDQIYETEKHLICVGEKSIFSFDKTTGLLVEKPVKFDNQIKPFLGQFLYIYCEKEDRILIYELNPVLTQKEEVCHKGKLTQIAFFNNQEYLIFAPKMNFPMGLQPGPMKDIQIDFYNVLEKKTTSSIFFNGREGGVSLKTSGKYLFINSGPSLEIWDMSCASRIKKFEPFRRLSCSFFLYKNFLITYLQTEIKIFDLEGNMLYNQKYDTYGHIFKVKVVDEKLIVHVHHRQFSQCDALEIFDFGKFEMDSLTFEES